MTAQGALVIVSRVDRSQALNRNVARGRLVTLLKRAAHPFLKQRIAGQGRVQSARANRRRAHGRATALSWRNAWHA